MNKETISYTNLANICTATLNKLAAEDEKKRREQIKKANSKVVTVGKNDGASYLIRDGIVNNKLEIPELKLYYTTDLKQNSI